jgi:glycosyltransferase involved in cell wall biosynthesis
MTGGEAGAVTGERSPSHELQVLSIVHSAVFGGPHNQAVQLHRELERSGGARLTVIMPDEPGDGPDRLRAAGVPVVQMPLLRPRASRKKQGILGLLLGYPGQILRLRRLVRERGADVVEVHGLLNPDGAVAARLAGRAVVWQLIDTRPPRGLRWLMMPVVLLLSDIIMTTGSAVAAEYPGARLRPDRLVPFVPPVGPLEAGSGPPEETRRATRERLAVPDGATLVTSVGNLNPQKGYESLIDAVADCRRRLVTDDLQLRVRGAVQTGHESYADGLRARSEAHGLPPGTIGEFEPDLGPAQLMGSSDIFAMTSRPRSEGLPTVVLEAMSVGLPVVVTEVGSMAEVVHDGVNGVLIQPDDPAQLTLALERLAVDPAERGRLGREGRRAVDHLASPETFARLQMQAYRLAVGRPWRRRQRSNRTDGAV